MVPPTVKDREAACLVLDSQTESMTSSISPQKGPAEFTQQILMHTHTKRTPRLAYLLFDNCPP